MPDTTELDLEVFIQMLDRYAAFCERHGGDKLRFLEGIQDAVERRLTEIQNQQEALAMAKDD